MIIFDSLIKEVLTLLHDNEYRALPISEELLPDVGKNNMVFENEKAYELGGGNKKSLSFELSTSDNSLLCKDEIILIGKDLNEITGDTDFIRLSLLNVKDDNIDGNELYGLIETIKFTKYHVSPSGYMLRTSSSNKEKVRLSKETAKESFSRIGAAYIKAYQKIPSVNSVKMVFITGENTLYDSFVGLAKRKDEITETVDHILKGMVLNDCGSCAAKELCDEVEGLRELHQIEKGATS